MILDRIVESVKETLESKRKEHPIERIIDAIDERDERRNFRKALEMGECAVIAEIKRSSPSAGRILESFDPAELAREYEKAGAAALSILTEERHFEGNLAFLPLVRNVTKIPLLRKDFIIDPYQIYESRAAGADAILLIAGILTGDKLREFIEISRSLGMAALVEVHDSEELNKALAVDAGIIGINNRDLKTFSVDLGTSIRLASKIPPGRIIVSESGIRGRGDILRLQKAGIRAYLVGEALSRSDAPADTLSELLKGDVSCR